MGGIRKLTLTKEECISLKLLLNNEVKRIERFTRSPENTTYLSDLISILDKVTWQGNYLAYLEKGLKNNHPSRDLKKKKLV